MTEDQIRLKAFEWIQQQQQIHGTVLPRPLLLKGFEVEGQKIGLLSAAQGIFKPAAFQSKPISILTTTKGPYEDGLHDDGFIHYCYQGTDSMTSTNVGLRQCMKDQTPLVYFHATMPGRYIPIWPVYIVDDDQQSKTFLVAADEHSMAYQQAVQSHSNGRVLEATELDPKMKSAAEIIMGSSSHLTEETNHYQFPHISNQELRRSYTTIQAKQRLFQHAFRDIVLQAYQEQCAFCQLRHAELLDAAHIIPDSHPNGQPVVTNGLSLCKIHHAAFDANIIGLRPDYVIEVNEQVLKELDGPMLKHGIQAMHHQQIILPKHKKDRPDEERLKYRYEQFRVG